MDKKSKASTLNQNSINNNNNNNNNNENKWNNWINKINKDNIREYIFDEQISKDEDPNTFLFENNINERFREKFKIAAMIIDYNNKLVRNNNKGYYNYAKNLVNLLSNESFATKQLDTLRIPYLKPADCNSKPLDHGQVLLIYRARKGELFGLYFKCLCSKKIDENQGGKEGYYNFIKVFFNKHSNSILESWDDYSSDFINSKTDNYPSFTILLDCGCRIVFTPLKDWYQDNKDKSQDEKEKAFINFDACEPHNNQNRCKGKLDGYSYNYNIPSLSKAKIPLFSSKDALTTWIIYPCIGCGSETKDSAFTILFQGQRIKCCCANCTGTNVIGSPEINMTDLLTKLQDLGIVHTFSPTPIQFIWTFISKKDFGSYEIRWDVVRRDGVMKMNDAQLVDYISKKFNFNVTVKNLLGQVVNDFKIVGGDDIDKRIFRAMDNPDEDFNVMCNECSKTFSIDIEQVEHGIIPQCNHSKEFNIITNQRNNGQFKWMYCPYGDHYYYFNVEKAIDGENCLCCFPRIRSEQYLSYTLKDLKVLLGDQFRTTYKSQSITLLDIKIIKDYPVKLKRYDFAITFKVEGKDDVYSLLINHDEINHKSSVDKDHDGNSTITDLENSFHKFSLLRLALDNERFNGNNEPIIKFKLNQLIMDVILKCMFKMVVGDQHQKVYFIHGESFYSKQISRLVSSDYEIVLDQLPSEILIGNSCLDWSSSFLHNLLNGQDIGPMNLNISKNLEVHSSNVVSVENIPFYSTLEFISTLVNNNLKFNYSIIDNPSKNSTSTILSISLGGKKVVFVSSCSSDLSNYIRWGIQYNNGDKMFSFIIPNHYESGASKSISNYIINNTNCYYGMLFNNQISLSKVVAAVKFIITTAHKTISQ